MFGRIHLWSYLIMSLCWEFFYYQLNFTFSNFPTQLYISSWFIFGRMYTSRNFLSGLFYWHIIVIIFYDPLWSCSMCCNLSSFISDFIWVLSLSLSFFFFLMRIAKGISVLFALLKEQLLLHWSFLLTLSIFFHYFCSDPSGYFSSNSFGFYFSFSS